MSFDREQLIALATQYGPPILKALAILVVGWLVAKVVAAGIRKILNKTDWDNRLAAYITRGKAEDLAIEEAVATVVYWLIMLFVLVMVFQVLELTIVTEPLTALLTQITSFLPRLLAAGALGLVAWVVASALRVVVGNLLEAFQLDRKIGESTGEEQTAGLVSLSKTLADAVFYLVLLLFLPQILDALQMEGLAPVRDMVGEILGFLPNLLGALVVFFIFYLVARIVQRLITNLLASLGFDRVPTMLGVTMEAESPRASTIAGWVVLTVFIALGVVQALGTLELDVVSSLANELLQGLFNILVACVIFGVGLLLSQLAYKTLASSGRSPALAWVARAAVIVFTGAMALSKTDLAPEIVRLAFGATIVGLAAAAALAFGFGGRDAAAQVIERWRSEQGSAAPPPPSDD